MYGRGRKSGHSPCMAEGANQGNEEDNVLPFCKYDYDYPIPDLCYRHVLNRRDHILINPHACCIVVNKILVETVMYAHSEFRIYIDIIRDT